MSRSGYSDDIDDVLAFGRWRGQVSSAIRGSRGQTLLKELLIALDEMPNKELYSGNFATASGEFCTLGVLGNKRGLNMSDLGSEEVGCDPEYVGAAFGIAKQLASEIMFLNDEAYIFGTTPDQRWKDMRKWIVENINDN